MTEDLLKKAINKELTEEETIELTTQFPFLIDEPLNEFEAKVMDAWNISNWIDEVPEGWLKAFGYDFFIELIEALHKDQCFNEFEFLQIKEKFGQLRIYASNYGNATSEVLSKYEELSKYYCIHCGKLATQISEGWICPWCDDCTKQIHSKMIPITDAYKMSQEEINQEIKHIKTSYNYKDYWKTIGE